MMKLLCFFGFHKWYHWYVGTTAAAIGPAGQEAYHETRTCERCGKIEHLYTDEYRTPT